jgi:hypothetical protein
MDTPSPSPVLLDQTAAAVPPPSLRSGPAQPPTIAGYEIIEHIGSGGMGSVYLARDLRMGSEVAIKVLPTSLLGSPAARKRFQREARSLAALDHPNIVRVLSLKADERQYALVMEHVRGEPLSQVLRRGPLDPEVAADLVMQICGALSYAHKRGIIHRDLKPGNILIVRQGDRLVPKLIDFGLARFATDDQKLTTTGALVGTPRYMSPEQCFGQRADNRSDIYALGCIIYECLTGKPVFDSENPMDLMFKHIHEQAPLLVAAEHKQFAGVVAKCLEKDPQQRFQQATDVIRALDSGVVPSTTAHAKARVALPVRKALIVCAALAFIAVVALGAGILMQFGGNHEQQKSAVAYDHLPLPQLLDQLKSQVFGGGKIDPELLAVFDARISDAEAGRITHSQDSFQFYKLSGRVCMYRHFRHTGNPVLLGIAARFFAVATQELHRQNQQSEFEPIDAARAWCALGDYQRAVKAIRDEIAFEEHLYNKQSGSPKDRKILHQCMVHLHLELGELYKTLGEPQNAAIESQWSNRETDEERDYMNMSGKMQPFYRSPSELRRSMSTDGLSADRQLLGLPEGQ